MPQMLFPLWYLCLCASDWASERKQAMVVVVVQYWCSFTETESTSAQTQFPTTCPCPAGLCVATKLLLLEEAQGCGDLTPLNGVLSDAESKGRSSWIIKTDLSEKWLLIMSLKGSVRAFMCVCVAISFIKQASKSTSSWPRLWDWFDSCLKSPKIARAYNTDRYNVPWENIYLSNRTTFLVKRTD